MTRQRRGGSVAVAGLVGIICLVVGLIPVLFLDAARRAGSIGELSAIGLAAMAAVVMVIAVLAGVVSYRAAHRDLASAADPWISGFLSVVVWSVGVLTLIPGLVFLRLSDNRSLNDYGAQFFLEWALLYVMIAAAAYSLGRWTLRSLAKSEESLPVASASPPA